MQHTRFASVLAAALLLAGTASAATVTSSYSVNSHASSAPHSVWFSGGNPAGATGPGQNRFLFENSTLGEGSLVQFDDATARMTGEVANAAGQTYRLDLYLEETADPGAYKPGDPASLGIDVSTWTFYSISSSIMSTLTYLGADGLDSFRLSEKAPHLAVQFGVGANDKNWDKLGLSTWLYFDEISCDGALGHSDACDTRYSGDINVLLAEAPLPASVLLMLAGLGGLGIARHRRKAA